MPIAVRKHCGLTLKQQPQSFGSLVWQYSTKSENVIMNRSSDASIAANANQRSSPKSEVKLPQPSTVVGRSTVTPTVSDNRRLGVC